MAVHVPRSRRVRDIIGDKSCPLLRYSGGGLGWGPIARTTFVLHNPHPCPPPEYRRREKWSRLKCHAPEAGATRPVCFHAHRHLCRLFA